jgi:hypothetical protein
VLVIEGERQKSHARGGIVAPTEHQPTSGSSAHGVIPGA